MLFYYELTQKPQTFRVSEILGCLGIIGTWSIITILSCVYWAGQVGGTK